MYMKICMRVVSTVCRSAKAVSDDTSAGKRLSVQLHRPLGPDTHRSRRHGWFIWALVKICIKQNLRFDRQYSWLSKFC